MVKSELRKEYLQKRKAIHSIDKLKLDDLMLIQFQQLNFSNIRSVLSYWPIAANNEPNSHLFSGYLRHHIYNIQLAYPVSNFKNTQMEAVAIDENTVYKKSPQQITEPTTGIVLDPKSLDLILVPLIICDYKGYRVGYGKGFYDQYLTRCKTTVCTVGFSYFKPVTSIEDVNAFDVPLSYCITPNEVFEF
jgi:5-formyltetrahydrofolate cyclo-ligase